MTPKIQILVLQTGFGSSNTSGIAEPCDDRDDGAKLNLPVVTMFAGLPEYGFYFRHPHWWNEWKLKKAVWLSTFLGITYRLGDTTTFSAGPYDESLGTPVTVHFRKV